MNLFIMPHPAFVIPEIGQGKQSSAAETVKGMEKIAEEIKQLAPKTIALISPHGNVFSDALCINTESELTGSFSEFHQPKLRIEVKGDLQKALVFSSGLRAASINNLALDEISAQKYNITTELDRGAMVPLYYIAKQYTDFKLIHINIGYLPKTQMYQAGKILAEIIGENAVIIASGNLSHKLSKDNSENYDEMGRVYDNNILEAVAQNDFLRILTADNNVADRAGQCAQKPLEMLMGALDGSAAMGEVYSYEAPFGTGYMTARIEIEKSNKENLINQYLEIKKGAQSSSKNNEDEYVQLAKNAIYNYVMYGHIMEIPQGLSEDLYIKQSGVFVSLKKEGKLRGCVGTVSPTKLSTAEEIISNAIEAAVKDSRFAQVQENEISELEIFVDVLSDLEEVKSNYELDIKRFGIVVTKGDKRGLLLPNIDGVKNADHQIDIALEKAGIEKGDDFLVRRFTVTRHKSLIQKQQ